LGGACLLNLIIFENVTFLPTTWNVDFALVDERERNRMQEKSNELGVLIQSCDWVMMRC
jgi:hypothetical protein